MKKASGNPWRDTFFARKTTEKVANQNLSGKTVIFTGGTDGMVNVPLNDLLKWVPISACLVETQAKPSLLLMT